MPVDDFRCNRKLRPGDLLALEPLDRVADESGAGVDGPLRRLTLCDEDDNFMSAVRQFDSGAGGRLDTVHSGAGDRHGGNYVGCDREMGGSPTARSSEMTSRLRQSP